MQSVIFRNFHTSRQHLVFRVWLETQIYAWRRPRFSRRSGTAVTFSCLARKWPETRQETAASGLFSGEEKETKNTAELFVREDSWNLPTAGESAASCSRQETAFGAELDGGKGAEQVLLLRYTHTHSTLSHTHTHSTLSHTHYTC